MYSFKLHGYLLYSGVFLKMHNNRLMSGSAQTRCGAQLTTRGIDMGIEIKGFKPQLHNLIVMPLLYNDDWLHMHNSSHLTNIKSTQHLYPKLKSWLRPFLQRSSKPHSWVSGEGPKGKKDGNRRNAEMRRDRKGARRRSEGANSCQSAFRPLFGCIRRLIISRLVSSLQEYCA